MHSLVSRGAMRGLIYIRTMGEGMVN